MSVRLDVQTRKRWLCQEDKQSCAFCVSAYLCISDAHFPRLKSKQGNLWNLQRSVNNGRKRVILKLSVNGKSQIQSNAISLMCQATLKLDTDMIYIRVRDKMFQILPTELYFHRFVFEQHLHFTRSLWKTRYELFDRSSYLSGQLS